MKRYLNASEVAELAELLEDFPIRTGMVDEVLQASEEGRGLTLELREVAGGGAASPTPLPPAERPASPSCP